MIRLAAAIVPYAALARLIAVLAWLVAALNIVHLLGPTLDFLDSVAVVVGGLRVSILTIAKGVLSLAMLLRESFGLDHAAAIIERSLAEVWSQGFRTADLAAPGCETLGTRAMTQRVEQQILQRSNSNSHETCAAAG